MESIRISNYSEINKLFPSNDLYYEPEVFTEFECQLFNGDLDVSNLNMDLLNSKDVKSLGIWATLSKNNVVLLKACKKLISLEVTEGYLLLGLYIYTEKKDVPAALQVYTNGSLKGCSKCFSNIGSIYLEKGEYEKALVYYNKSLNLNNENAHTYFLFAMTYSRLDNISKALFYLYKAVKLGHAHSLEILSEIIPPEELYYILLKIPEPAQLIQEKLRELKDGAQACTRLTPTNEIYIELENGTILDCNFENVGVDASFLNELYSNMNVSENDLTKILRDN